MLAAAVVAEVVPAEDRDLLARGVEGTDARLGAFRPNDANPSRSSADVGNATVTGAVDAHRADGRRAQERPSAVQRPEATTVLDGVGLSTRVHRCSP